MSKVWFITGCSTGFGRILAEELLKTDAKVVATARDTSKLAHLSAGEHSELLTLQLDVLDSSAIQAAVLTAQAHFGRIDVLVNNAGYGMMGALEETSIPALRRMFDTNVFGLVEVTQAVLPIMRAQHSGHIINLSSTAGVTATAGFAGYNGTKFAVEGISQALALEVAPMNIKVSIIEPGPFRTDFIGRSLDFMPAMPEYAESSGKTRQYLDAMDNNQPGDPLKAVHLMMAITEQANPPLHLPLGNLAYERIRAKVDAWDASLRELETTIRSADFSE